MIVISDAEALNLERSRQKGVAMLHSKNKWIANDATINQVIDKCEELNDTSGILDGTVTSVTDNQITKIRSSVFSNCEHLKSAKFDNATTVEDNIFYGCTDLEVIDMNNLKTAGKSAGYVFAYCSSLKIIYLKSLEEMIGQRFFQGTPVEKLIIPKCNACSSNTFSYATSNAKLIDYALTTIYSIGKVQETLILRADSVPTLSATNLIGDDCIIYIKSSLISTLKNETNWSALPNINSRVVALEGSDYEDPEWYEDTDEYKILFGDEEESEE